MDELWPDSEKKYMSPTHTGVFSDTANMRLHVYSHPSGFGIEIWTKHKLIRAGAEISHTGMN